MRLVTIFTFVPSAYWSNAQTLSLDDIFKVRTLDSTNLRTFASEKGYELREIDMDAWRSVHKYYAPTDTTAWFEITFPTGIKLFPQDKSTRDDKIVYYHFADIETQNEFKKKIKEVGFKFKRTDTKDFGGNKFTHNIFVKKNNEIDLASEKLLGQEIKYTLMYYGRMN